MSEVLFPGPGPDGEQPPPGGPARDDDWDADAEMASYIADLDAGRARIPEEWEIEGPAATISLGDAADVDLAELAAMVGPDGLGGEVFAQDRSADAMRPGPVLAALTEQAVRDLGRLTDNQVLGAMSAARRLAARGAWLELRAVAEFTRRREAQFEAARAARVPRGCRDGEFPDAELAMELVISPGAAGDQMGLARDLETRLPRASAGLGAKAHIDALAVALRRGGLPGTLQRLRVLAFTHLTQGRDPLARLSGPRPAGQAAAGGLGADPHDSRDADDSDDDASWDGYPDMPEWQHERRGTGDDDDHEDSTDVPPGVCPHRHLSGARLRRAGLPQRLGPHDPAPERAHRRVQPGPALPAAPSGQAGPRLDAHPARTRRHAVDHALRPQLHHPAYRLRNVAAIRRGATVLPVSHFVDLPEAADVVLARQQRHADGGGHCR